MNARSFLALAALLSSTTLTACGGAGGSAGSLPPSGNGTQSVQQQTEDSIDSANALGNPVKDFQSYTNDATGSPLQSNARSQSASRDLAANGTCTNGVEFFAPDKHGDQNSTELIEFYDNGCTAVARDAIRIWSSTGANSETVQRTVSLYGLNGTTPGAVRSETVSYTNATFDQYGFPILKNGFDRTHTGELSISGVKTIDGDGELVVAASSANSTTFCDDSAGFNATGNQALNETFGWAGVTPNGTRTVNSDGSVTWQTTHTGTAYVAPVGAFSIQAGAKNASCPIATPMFTLTGGTAKGQYDIPISATFMYGILTDLTVTNASLVNGDALNVQTNSGLLPSNSHFISGSLTKAGSAIANFNVDAFGDGVLVVAASGKQYQIEDWHVIK